MKNIFAVLFGLLLCASSVCAQHVDPANTVPQSNSAFMSTLQTYLKNEDANRYSELGFVSMVVSGGTHATGAGFTKTPTALIAYPGGYRITESGSITYPASDTCYIIANNSRTGNLTTFTRVAGTHYLMDCVSVSEPAQPAATVRLMTVVTDGSGVTAVTDRRTTSLNIGGGGVPALAATATALAADGTDCPVGQAPRGIDTMGNATGCAAISGGAGPPVTLDLGNNAVNESAGLGAIATTGDTNSIFTEPSADKLLIDVSKKWPAANAADTATLAAAATALASDGANCITGQAPLGVDAQGAAQGCFDVATQAELDAHIALTSAHGATPANTAGRPVQRDGAGNFAANIVTANVTGNVTGNSATATLATTSTTANKIRSVTVATLPTSPSPGDVVIVTDGLTANGCEVNGGTFQTVCRWNDFTNHWEPAVTAAGGSSTLQAAKDAGAVINNAVDLSTCVRIGNAVIQSCKYADSSNVIHEKTVNAAGAALAADYLIELDAAKLLRILSSAGVLHMSVDEATGDVTMATLKTTGAAGTKKVVCVDTATGKLYASSTSTACDN